MRLALVVLILFQIAPSRPSKGQDPKEPRKESTTQQREKTPNSPSNQTIVIEQPESRPASGQQKQPEQEKTTEDSRDWADKVNAVSTLVIALFTAGTVLLLVRQIRDTRTRERAWAAFFLPEVPVVVREGTGGKPSDCLIVGFIKNVGDTPATITRKFHFLNVIEIGETLPPSPEYLKEQESQTEYLMVPEASEAATVGISGYHILNAAKFQIRILGQIVYRDAFGRPHETRYCLRYYHESTPGKLRGSIPTGLRST